MGIDFVAEDLTKCYFILEGVAGGYRSITLVVPQMNPIDKVEASSVRDAVSRRLIIGTEEYGCRKYSLEALH